MFRPSAQGSHSGLTYSCKRTTNFDSVIGVLLLRLQVQHSLLEATKRAEQAESQASFLSSQNRALAAKVRLETIGKSYRLGASTVACVVSLYIMQFRQSTIHMQRGTIESHVLSKH